MQAAESEPGEEALELGILPGTGAGAQIKDQKEPELNLKFRTGARAMATGEVLQLPVPS